MFGLFINLCLLLIGLTVIIVIRSYRCSCVYFAKLGIPFAQPTLLFGNMFKVTFGRASIADLLNKYYREFHNEKYAAT